MTASTAVAPAAGPRPSGGLADAARDTYAVLWRDMVRTARQPEMLIFGAVMGVFFLVLFTYVFGGAIGAGAGVDYLQYLVPGVLVITALQGAQQTSLSLAADLAEGVTDRFRSLPMSQLAVIAGRTVADAARNVVGLLLVVVLALVMGYRFGSFGAAVGAIALTAAVGFGFSWLGAAVATAVRKPDLVGMLSMFWLFPLMLASTAFAPVASMPGWLQPFVAHQPVSAAADAVRGLGEGSAGAGEVLVALGWAVALVAVFAPLSLRLHRRAA